MKDIELKNKIIKKLSEKSYETKVFPASFTAREIANEVDGYPPRVGVVAGEVVKELKARGVVCNYENSGSSKVFVVYEKE